MLKKSKLFKGFVVTTLAVALLVPTAAFANENSSTDESMKAGFERREMLSERRQEFKANREKYRDVDHGRLLNVIETYAEEDLDAWKNLFEEREELREEIKEVRGEIKDLAGEKKEEKRDEIKAYRDELMAKVEAEEMTKEEAREEFKDYIEDIKGDVKEKREEWKEKREEKKEEFQAIKEEVKEMRESLVEAVKEDDSEEVNNILDTMFDYFTEHTEWLQEKLENIKERIEEEQ